MGDKSIVFEIHKAIFKNKIEVSENMLRNLKANSNLTSK